MNTFLKENSLQSLIEKSKREAILIFKHSITCGRSAGIHAHLTEHVDKIKHPIYIVEIQNNKNLSDEIAQHFSVKHESPQLLLIKNGACIYEKHHNAINYSNIPIGI